MMESEAKQEATGRTPSLRSASLLLAIVLPRDLVEALSRQIGDSIIATGDRWSRGIVIQAVQRYR